MSDAARARVVAVLQARASSTRLPGKVLKPILGAPMLALHIERLQRCRSFGRLVLATSTEPSDDPVAAVAARAGIAVFRGALDDVLDRFHGASRPFAPSHVVRLTGDCPLADPALIDRVVALALAADADFTSNTLERTWPRGLDVEVVRFAALETAWRESTAAEDREHVLEFVHRQPWRFRLQNLRQEEDLSGLRWTVDLPRDFEFVRRVYEALRPAKPDFGTEDVLALLRRTPGIVAINAGLEDAWDADEACRRLQRGV